MKILTAVAAISAVFAACASTTEAQAATSPVNHDVQCFIAASQIAMSDDADTKNAGTMATMYFAGKIFGVNPSINLNAALEAEADRMASVDMKALMKDCSSELETRGNQLQAAGQALAAKGK